MLRCAFCPRPAPGQWAMTACAVTGERWYGGHTVGRPSPRWTPGQAGE